MKVVDSHGDGIEPFSDVVPLGMIETTAQLAASGGSQIAAVINEKLCVCDIVFLGEVMQKRCGGVRPAAAADVNFNQQF